MTLKILQYLPLSNVLGLMAYLDDLAICYLIPCVLAGVGRGVRSSFPTYRNACFDISFSNQMVRSS